MRADTAERKRRQRADARLQRLADDCAAVRETIDARIDGLVGAFHARQVRPRVCAVMAKVTAHLIKCAGAEGPDYDPDNRERHDGLAGVDYDFLLLNAEMALIASLNSVGLDGVRLLDNQAMPAAPRQSIDGAAGKVIHAWRGPKDRWW